MNQQNEHCFPKGKIILASGKELECYPKDEQPAVIQPDEPGLDTTGVYLQIGKQKARKTPAEKDNAWMDLFYKNAFFLYEHKEDILSDSRMFLTPLPFKNNLAYTGTNGLQHATLGIYLEWWESCQRAVLRDKDGTVRALTYFIAGSPLSGSNHCSAVNRRGKRETVQFSPFIDIWRTFIQINTRYTEAKQVYQAYTLEETIRAIQASADRPSSVEP